jgi:hypothetical protein
MCDNARECEAAVRQGFAGREPGDARSRDTGAGAPDAEGVHPPKALVDRLGVKEGMRVSVMCVSDVEVIDAVTERSGDVSECVAREGCDAILYEADGRGDLSKLPKLARSIKRDGMLWVLWPRGGKLKQSDVQHAGLDAGLVDVKVTRVSETLSALKFVYRVSDR